MSRNLGPNAANSDGDNSDRLRVDVVEEMAVIKCAGKLTGDAVVGLEHAVIRAARSSRSMLIDVSSVTDLDSTAVATVIRLAKGIVNTSGRVVFECPPSAARDTFADLGLDRWLPLEPTRSAARARLRAGASPP